MLKNQIKGSLLMGALSGFCVGNLIISLNCFFSYERHPYLEPLSRVCSWIFGISFLCAIMWTLIQVVNQKILFRCFIIRLLLGGIFGVPFYHIWIIAVEIISRVKSWIEIGH